MCTLTGTASGNTISGTYTATDSSTGTWRTVKVQLISTATTTTTISVPATAQFTATAHNYGGTTVPFPADSDCLTWTSSDTAVATISASGLATGKSAGTTTITASCGGMDSAGVTLTVTASGGGGGGGTPGTLTVNLDLTSAATVTTAPALVSAMVYTAGTLVAESPANFKITNRAGSFVADAAGSNADAVLDPGQYAVYILVDNDGSGSMAPGEYGKIATVTINGNKTLSFTAADFVATEGVSVFVTGSSVPDTEGMRCDWLVPGGAWQAINNPSYTVLRGMSFTSVTNTFSGGTVITDANTPLIPGQYDLHCWVDTNGDNVKNTGDFFGTNTNYLIGETFSLTAVP